MGALRELTARGRQWQATIKQWERSGLTAREFCARHGLNAATLSWWRSRIRHAGGPTPDKESIELVEIGRTDMGSGDGFGLELRNGVRVQVPMHFDAAALKQLLAVVATC